VNQSTVNAAEDSTVFEPELIDEEGGGHADPILCSLCGGPERLCGGADCCLGGPRSVAEQRWLVALRAAYAGLVLTTTPAALWGGALLRLARQLAACEQLPRSLAVEYADPCCALPASEAAKFAIAYLKGGDLASLQALQPLRDARARWLMVVCTLGLRAALATPLEGNTFGLVAVVCDRCVSRARSRASILGRVAPAGTYDSAIRCPKCGVVAPHPLPRIEIGEPHPVSRCVASGTRGCLSHDGEDLDADGLCAAGRAVYDQAVAKLARKEGTPTTRDRDLLDALLRAQRWQWVLPAALRPVFTTLAKVDPEVARTLAHLNVSSIDGDGADPVRGDHLARPSDSRVLAAVELALERAFKSFIDELANHATNGRSRRS
jgi:hypothetical protein